MILNGNYFRYNTTTGVFTAPAGHAGLYYFNVYMAVTPETDASFKMFQRSNGLKELCNAVGDTSRSPGEYATATCSATVELDEGNLPFIHDV